MNTEKITQDMLKVDFLGFQLINPFILASAPPTRDYDSIRKGFQCGWAGAITKSIVADPQHDKTPRIGHIYEGNTLTATQNFEMGSEYSALKWIEWTSKLSKEFPDRLLYVSIEGDRNINEWMRLAAMFMDTGIQGLELNFSSPHTDHMGTGSILIQNIDLCIDIVKAVKKVVGGKLKIMPKLPYLVHPNEGIAAKRLFEAGADAVTAINTIAGLCEFNINTMEPKLNVGGFTAAGGMSYDILRPFARLIISNIANSTDWNRYPISACGGVSKKVESMAEYFILGANNLQVCTEVMNFGFEVIEDMKKNLLMYLEDTCATIDKIRGCGLKNIKKLDELDDIKRVACVKSHLCAKCNVCKSFCCYGAITNNESMHAEINPQLCAGCGSCILACASQAIRLKEICE